MARKDVERALSLLGPLEGRIMKEVWGESVRSPFVGWDVQERMVELAYTTVMTTIGRLAEKGLLMSERVIGQRAVLYRPTGSPEEFLRRTSRLEVEELVRTFGEVALVAFESKLDELTPEQRQRLRELADR